MKKRLLALSMAVVMAFGLTACGGSGSGNAGTTTAAAGGSETTAAAASGKTYKIKQHHDLAEDSSQHEGLVKLKDLVEEKSGGAVQIQIFPNNTLGSDEEVAEMLQTGSVEAALIPTAKLSGFYAPLQLLDLPFVFPNRDACYGALDDAEFKSMLLDPMGDIGFIVYDDTRLILRQLQQLLILRIQYMAAVQYDDYKLCLGNCL